MKLARFIDEHGAVRLGRVIDDSMAEPLAGTMLQPGAPDGPAVRIARLLAPIDPPNIFCIGRNYRAHAEETGSAVPERPLIFQKPTTALIGPGETIHLPTSAPQQVDFEAELVVVIGRTARRVAPGDALNYVLGYTCANDVSARDCQKNDKQWTRAKGFDTFCPLGPWLVTADAFSPDDVRVSSRLNGAVMQSARSSAMIHSCGALVSDLSHQFTLLPGTLILTGTPEGVGMARTPPVFLKPGDRIEVEVEGIGVLTNLVSEDS